MIKNLYSKALNHTFEINYDIENERKRRYEGHRNKFRPYGYCGHDEHEPHR